MCNKDALAREDGAHAPSMDRPDIRSKQGSRSNFFSKGGPSWGANLAFLLFSVALVGCIAFGFAFPERAPVAILGVTVLLVAMAFTQLEKFESIKGAGVEFKLRQAAERAEKASEEAKATTEQVKATTEQAKATTEEAKATTAELRATASMLARLVLELLALNGLMAKIPDATKLKIKEDLDEALRAVGVPEEEIAALGERLCAAIRLGHADKVRDAALKRWSETHPEHMKGESYKALQRALTALADYESVTAAKPERFRAIIERIGIMGPEVEERLADYEYYIEHGRIRRSEPSG
jgi:hypothetical protein